MFTEISIWTWMACLQHSYCLGLSQAEAKTSEGLWLDGHGEKQRGCRSVSSTFFPSFMFLFLSVCCLSQVCMCLFSDCYVADELVVSRAGRRVRVGNTDAEGRMVMVDLLSEMKEKVRTSCYNKLWINLYSLAVITPSHLYHAILTLQAVQETSPQLFTIATLTGHAIRAMGPNYSVSTVLMKHWDMLEV